MIYCYLGESGLEVSRIGLGTIPFGTDVDEETCQRIVDLYQNVGGNLVDTSNLYGGGMRGSNIGLAGKSEQTVGNVLKGRRDRFIIATKGYWLMEDEVTPNSVGLSRTYLTRNIEASLRRLQTDYIDLYQCHAFDYYTPMEETMRVLDDFVRAGKIRYVGVSNWYGWGVVKANAIARQSGLTPVISNQIWYNLADRTAEHSVIPACRDQRVSIISWGVLGGGFLSGRYRRGAKGPRPGSNLTVQEECESSYWKNLAVERNWKLLDSLDRLAERHGTKIVNVVIQWALQCGMCDVALVGGSSLAQFETTLKGKSFRLSHEEMQELGEISRLPEPYPNNFLNLFCRRGNEFYGGLRVSHEDEDFG